VPIETRIYLKMVERYRARTEGRVPPPYTQVEIEERRQWNLETVEGRGTQAHYRNAPSRLCIDHVGPLHHPTLAHVRPRPSVGFDGGRLQDPTRRLPRSCPCPLFVHESFPPMLAKHTCTQ